METKEGNNMDDLLVKKLLGEASAADLYVIDTWLARSSENQRYFSHFDLIWSQSKQLAAQRNVDEGAAWERFKARVDEGSYEARVVPLGKSRVMQILRIAAVLFVLVGSGWLVYIFKIKSIGNEQIISRSGAGTKTDTLPDGSVVTLNRNSSISFPDQFSGDKRQVRLTGEAFFDVTPDEKKPFIIEANDVTVRVVGTTFNVKTGGEKTEVIVETGLVEVSRAREMVKLKPQQMVTVSTSDFDAKHTRDEFYNYYRTRKLECNNTPLWRLVEILNEIYGVEIVIKNEQLKQKAINTTFDGLTLEGTLTLISDTFNIKVMREGKRIILQ